MLDKKQKINELKKKEKGDFFYCYFNFISTFPLNTVATAVSLAEEEEEEEEEEMGHG